MSERFAADVRRGLARPGQKTLPSEYLYDATGSALFEAITLLPEYGLTRADARLLRTHASGIIARSGNPTRVLELGSGTGSKTRWVLEAAVQNGPVTYCPIDVSDAALDACTVALGSLPNITVEPHHAQYFDGLRAATCPHQTTLVLFLGSTIGNFNPAEAAQFLTCVRKLLQPGDSLLLGTDLEQPIATMIVAYDDPIGITAAFNLNLLARINRQLGGHFDPRSFTHEARFNAAESRMEMHLVSKRDQTIAIDGLAIAIPFTAGESIWTEFSYKFTLAGIAGLTRSSGFDVEAQWVDEEWAFAETLLRVRSQ